MDDTSTPEGKMVEKKIHFVGSKVTKTQNDIQEIKKRFCFMDRSRQTVRDRCQASASQRPLCNHLATLFKVK